MAMQISCPNCGTAFSVPDTALGPKGRTLRCAKCGHKWFHPVASASADFSLDDLPPPPKPRPAAEEPAFASGADWEGGNAAAAAAGRAAARLGMNLGLDDDRERPEADAATNAPNVPMDFGGEPEPIPDVFRRTEEPAKKGGTAGLWLLLIVLLLCGLAGAVYYFQDKVVELWPPADGLLTDMGARHEKPGAGLELRNAGTPERTVFNGVDVLIVRGVIANISDRTRMVPPMKLTLLDKSKHVVQSKFDKPPVTSLDPNGTASFTIQLQRPDPSAVEVNVVFVDPKDFPAK